MADSSGSALQVVEATIQKTASVIAGLNHPSGTPSKSFQNLIRAIGEAKTKHVKKKLVVELLFTLA